MRHSPDQLRERAAKAREALAECRLCPRDCGVDRLAGAFGKCGAGADGRVASVSVHHGEEPPISGSHGSGTVFWSHCNLSCFFCQNYPISQMGVGNVTTTATLADRLVDLKKKRAHNINFVTPTPHIAQVIGALAEAAEKGFDLPVVYNTNGYDSQAGLQLLDGVVDIYLPDIKTRSSTISGDTSGAVDYPDHNADAVKEMYRQVGPLVVDGDGIARRGVLIRHLVLPGHPENTVEVLGFICNEFGAKAPVSLMGQYFPAWRAGERAGFESPLSPEEYEKAIEAAERLGMDNVYIQEIPCQSERTSGKSC